MDFSSINGLSYSTAQANVNSANANSLTNSLNKISSESTEEELKGVLKDFESYFVEQVLKQMKLSIRWEKILPNSFMSK